MARQFLEFKPSERDVASLRAAPDQPIEEDGVLLRRFYEALLTHADASRLAPEDCARAAGQLASSRAFMQNSVTVRDDAAQFVRNGKSVFCKFVTRTGRHVLPGGEVVVLDESGLPIAVGRAKLPGAFMREFKAGVAVKVRSAHE